MKLNAVLLTILCGITLAGQAMAQQVPPTQTPNEVTAPAEGVVMHPAYAKTGGRVAYVWGWPMVNMLNRRAAITQAPEPGRLNGVLPVAPCGSEDWCGARVLVHV